MGFWHTDNPKSRKTIITRSPIIRSPLKTNHKYHKTDGPMGYNWQKNMKKLFLIAILIGFTILNTFAQNDESQYGSLISSGDYYEQLIYLGSPLCDRNVKISIYNGAVVKNEYKRGTRELSLTRWIYYYDHVDNNGNRIYSARNGNAFFRPDQFTLYSDGSFSINSGTTKFIISNGFRDLQPVNNSQPVNNNSFNNSYNNSYNNSSSRTCSLCNGSGQCCGAGNVAFSNQYCGGTGRCHPCYGTGWITNTVTGNKMKCTYCGGSGICSHCRGTGACERCGGSGKH